VGGVHEVFHHRRPAGVMLSRSRVIAASLLLAVRSALRR